MASGKPFPLNAWYPAAWSHEVERAPTARTICGSDLVLYRRADGAVAALEDACWHRLLPLSMGRLVGDQVVCGYHGLVFNSAGRCTHMPAQKTINPSIAIQIAAKRVRNRNQWEAGAERTPGSTASVLAGMLMALSPLRRGDQMWPGCWPTRAGSAAARNKA